MGPKIRLRVITFYFLKILFSNTRTITLFPYLDRNTCSTEYMCECGILCMSNDYADEINERMIDRFPGKAMVF
jgi:hypothetical protein